MIAITNYHKLSDLPQDKFILSLFWRSITKISIIRLKGRCQQLWLLLKIPKKSLPGLL